MTKPSSPPTQSNPKKVTRDAAEMRKKYNLDTSEETQELIRQHQRQSHAAYLRLKDKRIG